MHWKKTLSSLAYGAVLLAVPAFAIAFIAFGPGGAALWAGSLDALPDGQAAVQPAAGLGSEEHPIILTRWEYANHCPAGAGCGAIPNCGFPQNATHRCCHPCSTIIIIPGGCICNHPDPAVGSNCRFCCFGDNTCTGF